MTEQPCAWAGCDAPAIRKRLCEVHVYMWAPERYLHGAEPEDRRLRSDGYVECSIDGLWHMEHRLVMTRHVGRLLEHHEVIIHKDNNFANNDLDNLMLTDKSGAMKYRKEHPRSKFVSDRAFRIIIELDVEFEDAVESIAAVTQIMEDTIYCDPEQDAYDVRRFKVKRVTPQVRSTSA